MACKIPMSPPSLLAPDLVHTIPRVPSFFLRSSVFRVISVLSPLPFAGDKGEFCTSCFGLVPLTVRPRSIYWITDRQGTLGQCGVESPIRPTTHKLFHLNPDLGVRVR